MKGLLLKDFYTLFKQLKIMLVIIVVFTFLPGSSFSTFAIMYSAMLPITALAFDERSKWNLLASMMPYSEKELVLSKYVLGYISISGAAILSIIAKFIMSMLGKSIYNTQELMPIIAMAFLGTILISINMPIMKKFGVEKGRLVFILLIIVIVSGITAINSIGSLEKSMDISPIYYAAGIVICIIINIVSIEASVRIRKND